MSIKHVFDKFENQLYQAGLTEKHAPLLGFLDAGMNWNREDPDCAALEKVFAGLSINSLLFSRPAEPYATIIDFLAKNSGGIIYPSDCETRTFLHDLPVVEDFNPDALISALKQRKSVIIPGKGIAAWGTVSLEQAYVTFSSVCFAGFVKFFSDYLFNIRHGKGDTIDPMQRAVFKKAVLSLNRLPAFSGFLLPGPFNTEEEVHAAMDEAGKLTVSHRLVDSFFGNISYCTGDTLYISQSGSSLDHLPSCIDPCLMDGSSCAGITASSELSAHMEIVNRTGYRAVLHGHPKFSVILSMDCDHDACGLKGECHRKCSREREVCGIPIVPGEVGTGTYGLCNTVPKAFMILSL